MKNEYKSCSLQMDSGVRSGANRPVCGQRALFRARARGRSPGARYLDKPGGAQRRGDGDRGADGHAGQQSLAGLRGSAKRLHRRNSLIDPPKSSFSGKSCFFCEFRKKSLGHFAYEMIPPWSIATWTRCKGLCVQYQSEQSLAICDPHTRSGSLDCDTRA